MAEAMRVGILVPGLFVRVPVEQAVRGLFGAAVALRDAAEARRSGCSVILADVETLEEDDIRALIAAGSQVVVFGPTPAAERLAAARRAGAVALPRSLFLERLPEILASAGSGRFPRA